MKLVYNLLLKPYRIALTLSLLTMSPALLAKPANNRFAPPVFWNIFDAEVNRNSVTLKWTVTEYNNKVFYVQQSVNGQDWKTIDSVNTKNSPLTLDDYSFTFISKIEGRQYYRVRQVDIDLKSDGYSQVVSVIIRNVREEKSNPASVTLTPNPATDEIRMINTDSKTNVLFTSASIFDLTGKLVAEKKVEPHNNTVIVRDLPAGIYILRARGADGSSFSQKIIKQ
jgi:hypothetical protein